MTTVDDAPLYTETERYRTWHKHVRDLYQINVLVDTVWTTRSVQFMPYLTRNQQLSEDSGKQTILYGTHRDGEQNYVQMIDVDLPQTVAGLRNAKIDPDSFEVGGYGCADTHSGCHIERRMFHDGAVLGARYMPSNPLLIATCSDNGNNYIFDLGTISSTKPPNDKRPTCPYPPHELAEDATPEQRIRHSRRMHELTEARKEQERWDSRRGEGQHIVTLTGLPSTGVGLEWSRGPLGEVASGSDNGVTLWRIAHLSRSAPKVVEPYGTVAVGQINDVKYHWMDDARLYATVGSGHVAVIDTRTLAATSLVQCPGTMPISLALSPLNDVVLATGTEDGRLFIFDQRNTATPITVTQLHEGEIGPISWSPFVEGHLVTGGQDGFCTLYDAKEGEVLFKHAAHTDPVTDIDWSWQDSCAGQIISCDANTMSLWKPRNALWAS